MSRGYWRAFFAIMGVVLIGTLLATGYYQLESSEQQPYPTEEYQPARGAGLPELVENGKVATEPYEPNCHAPQSKDDSDLCAQWGAVQATTEANRLDRIGLRVNYLEFAALIGSLIFTGWAAFAAAGQVRLSRVALSLTERAYVSRSTFITSYIYAGSDDIISGFNISVGWHNTGNTPAINTITQLNFVFIEGPSIDTTTLPFNDLSDIVYVWASLGPQSTVNSGQVYLSIEQARKIADGKGSAFLWGWYEYDDIFEGSPRHRTEFAVLIGVDPHLYPGKVKLVEIGFGPFNGVDEGCLHKPKTSQKQKAQRR